MTMDDRVAELEAQLEVALRDADDERSTRLAVDALCADLKRQVKDLRLLLSAVRTLADVREVPS